MTIVGSVSMGSDTSASGLVLLDYPIIEDDSVAKEFRSSHGLVEQGLEFLRQLAKKPMKIQLILQKHFLTYFISTAADIIGYFTKWILPSFLEKREPKFVRQCWNRQCRYVLQ